MHACDGRRQGRTGLRPGRTNGGRRRGARRRARSAPRSLPYSAAMASTTDIFAWPRLRFTLIVSGGIGFLMGLHSNAALPLEMARAVFVGLAALMMFGVFERWPRRMPRWLPRTVLRLIAIAIIVPIASGIAIALTG